MNLDWECQNCGRVISAHDCFFNVFCSCRHRMRLASGRTMSESKFCPNCGIENIPENKECWKCKVPFGEPSEQTTETSKEESWRDRPPML